MAAYFVDNSGSDSATGLVGHPWQTCSKVNAATLTAGDSVAFTAGQTFAGPLTIINSGSVGSYISIGTGRGTTPARVSQSNPAIITAADGSVVNGINLNDCEYVWLDNLSVTGSGVNTSTGVSTSTTAGISIKSTQGINRLQAVRVTACSVSGCKDGIFVWTSAVGKKGWNDLQIWGCVIHACQRTSIITINYNLDTSTGSFAQGANDESTNIYIGYCHCYDLPGKAGGAGVGNCGEGPTVRNCTTGTVEYCVAHDINIVGNQGPGGTTGFDASITNGIVFQFCEAYNIFSPQAPPIDGCGIDIESGAINCIVQGCYFHDCDGAGFLSGTTIAANNTGNTFRYNALTRNAMKNQAEIYNFGGTGSGSGSNVQASVYANTVYATQGDCYVTSFGANQSDSLYNNILVSKAGSKCVNGIATALLGNNYFALGGGTVSVRVSGVTYTTLPTLQTAGYEVEVNGNKSGLFADPLLSDPANAPATGTLPNANVATISNFDIPLTSPAAYRGINITGISPGSIDFRGNPNGSPGLYDAGAVEISANTGRTRMR